MEKSIVATGKTIDIAIENALAQLGLDRDSVQVQVLAQAKAGFLGFGAQPAKVQVTYEVPDEKPATPAAPQAPKTALSSASRSKPKAKPVAPAQEAPKAPKAPVQEAPKAAAPAKQEQPVKPAKAAKPAPEQKPQKEEKTTPVVKEYAPAPAGSVEEKIEVFIQGLLKNMGSNAVPHAWKEEDTYRVDLTGEDLGYLIGHRGDTLDAIQHLANYAVGRNVDDHIRISVDAENYRSKREDGLRRYARKKAMQVLKAHRRTTLEPMNAYERHVIHATLQDMENITTHSTGTEPNRRVVIEYVR